MHIGARLKPSNFIELVNTKAQMTLKSEAAGLYLSYLWWILEPLIYVFAFYFVFNILLKNTQENFLLFLMCGKIPYLWFSKSITSASGSLVGNRGLISQLDITKAIFPYAVIQVCLYKEWPVYLILLAMTLMYGYSPSLSWFWLIPLILVQYLIIASLGMLSALLVCYADDFRMIINMGMLFILFISGVFFDLSAISDPHLRDMLMTYNPLSFLIDGYRLILMEKGMYDLNHLGRLFLFFIGATVAMHWIYAKYSRTIAAKVVSA